MFCHIIWAVPCKKYVLGICSYSGEQMPRWNFSHMQDDVNSHILGMFDGTFSLVAAHIIKMILKALSRRHAYIILTPLKTHFQIVKLGFTGVHNIFLSFAFAKNIDYGYSLELLCWGSSSKYPQSIFAEAVLTSTHKLFWAEIWKFSVFCRWIFCIFE